MPYIFDWRILPAFCSNHLNNHQTTQEYFDILDYLNNQKLL
jgi:hypothetical protein